jgi:hypothetical protein
MSYPARVTNDPWIGDEWRLVLAARRVFVRAAHRPLVVSAVALAIAGTALGLRATAPPVLEGSLHFLLREGDLTSPGHEAQPSPDVAAYIAEVALSRAELEPMLRKHRWSLAWLNRDPVGAMAEFREELVIDVRRNYFIYPRGRDDPPRSAHVSLRLVGADPETVTGVLHDIAAAIQRDQAARRATHLSGAGALFETELARAREQVRSVAAEIAVLERARRTAAPRDTLPLEGRLAALRVENELALDRVVALEGRVSEVRFSGAAAHENLGMTFELLDEHLATLSPELTRPELARLGVLYLAFALVAAAAFVGALDDRVYAPGDLMARGLPVFGALPRFPGDAIAAHRARTHEVPR